MNDVYIHPLAVVDDGAVIGEGSKIWHFAHIRSSAELGSNVIIGKSSYVDAHVRIGNNVKVQNLVSIYHGVTIKNDVFIGPHAVFTNDLYPRSTGDWKIIETKVENGVSIGANSTIICGITLGKNCLIAAGSVVTKDVPANGLVMGNPAKLKGYVCLCARKLLNMDAEPGSYSITCDQCGRNVDINVV